MLLLLLHKFCLLLFGDWFYVCNTMHVYYYFLPYLLASASFNPITHEQYNGDGPLPQHYQQAAPPQPQANVESEQAYGRRDKPVRGTFILCCTRCDPLYYKSEAPS